MVINEKALLSRMKEAYKSGGYTVAVRGHLHMIQTPTWAVEIESKNLPRDVIGLLAVHMGFLPEPGTAYKITRTKSDPQVQSMIFEDAVKPVENLEAVPIAVGMKKTRVTLDGRNVWQRNIGLGVELLAPELEALLKKTENVDMAEGAFRCIGEISRVYLMRVESDPEDAKIRCLSGIRWTA